MPAEISARFPGCSATPGLRTTKSDSSSSAIPCALAYRSLISCTCAETQIGGHLARVHHPRKVGGFHAAVHHGAGQSETSRFHRLLVHAEKLANDLGRPGKLRAGKNLASGPAADDPAFLQRTQDECWCRRYRPPGSLFIAPVAMVLGEQLVGLVRSPAFPRRSWESGAAAALPIRPEWAPPRARPSPPCRTVWNSVASPSMQSYSKRSYPVCGVALK